MRGSARHGHLWVRRTVNSGRLSLSKAIALSNLQHNEVLFVLACPHIEGTGRAVGKPSRNVDCVAASSTRSEQGSSSNQETVTLDSERLAINLRSLASPRSQALQAPSLTIFPICAVPTAETAGVTGRRLSDSVLMTELCSSARTSLLSFASDAFVQKQTLKCGANG